MASRYSAGVLKPRSESVPGSSSDWTSRYATASSRSRGRRRPLASSARACSKRYADIRRRGSAHGRLPVARPGLRRQTARPRTPASGRARPCRSRTRARTRRAPAPRRCPPADPVRAPDRTPPGAGSGGSARPGMETTTTSSTLRRSVSTTCATIGRPRQGSQALGRPMREERPPHSTIPARPSSGPPDPVGEGREDREQWRERHLAEAANTRLPQRGVEPTQQRLRLRRDPFRRLDQLHRLLGPDAAGHALSAGFVAEEARHVEPDVEQIAALGDEERRTGAEHGSRRRDGRRSRSERRALPAAESGCWPRPGATAASAATTAHAAARVEQLAERGAEGNQHHAGPLHVAAHAHELVTRRIPDAPASATNPRRAAGCRRCGPGSRRC